ncbi:hypothetical protein [Actinomadura oligospora]|uniref:hypothetical protein n=1 Tax=Actinomadura oligospora TaxID=111804 RepID=UPI00047D0B8E|nr:hypothetical protein [Actinomadura oligospora]
MSRPSGDNEFVAAARAGDLSGLEKILAEDAVSHSDGGGAVRASRFPVVGAGRVARYVRAFAHHFWTGVDVRVTSVNGQPAALLFGTASRSPSSPSVSPRTASTRSSGR